MDRERRRQQIETERERERKGSITQHCKFGDFTLALSDHVCADAHVLPGIALPGICDHQLPSAYLRGIEREEVRGSSRRGKTATLESETHSGGLWLTQRKQKTAELKHYKTFPDCI